MTNSNRDEFDQEERAALARVALASNNLAEALRMLKPLLDASDTRDEVVGLAAMTYAQLGLLGRAETLYQRYLEKRPQATLERFQLSVVQAQLGKLSEAQRFWGEILKEQPNFFPALLYQGMALLQGGRLAEAKQTLERVLQLAPSNAPHATQAKALLQAIAA